MVRHVPPLLGVIRVPVVPRLGSVDVCAVELERVVDRTRRVAVDEAFGIDEGARGVGLAVVRVDAGLAGGCVTGLAGGCVTLGLETTCVGAGTTGAGAAGFTGSDAAGFAGVVRATAAGGSGASWGTGTIATGDAAGWLGGMERV